MSALRRTVAGVAAAVLAVPLVTATASTAAATPAAAGPAVVTEQPDPSQWEGPFFTLWHCDVVLALRGDEGPCQFNPDPPTTSWGWWYKLDQGGAR